jgi:Holliday junction resolvase RusA-like endonuclease
VVHGDPIPKARPRFVNGRTYTDPRTTLAEARIRATAKKAGVVRMTGAIGVELVYFRATKRRCDWDNLAKLTCDALNGIAWEDDSQIIDAHVVLGVDAENPRVEVLVSSTEPRTTPISWEEI